MLPPPPGPRPDAMAAPGRRAELKARAAGGLGLSAARNWAWPYSPAAAADERRLFTTSESSGAREGPGSESHSPAGAGRCRAAQAGRPLRRAGSSDAESLAAAAAAKTSIEIARVLQLSTRAPLGRPQPSAAAGSPPPPAQQRPSYPRAGPWRQAVQRAAPQPADANFRNTSTLNLDESDDPEGSLGAGTGSDAAPAAARPAKKRKMEAFWRTLTMEQLSAVFHLPAPQASSHTALRDPRFST